MPITDFRPKPGRYGVQPTFLNTPMTLIAVAAAPTNTDYLGAPPTRSIFSKATVSAYTLPAGATTLTAKLVKRRAGTDTDLTSATAIQAGANAGSVTLTNVATLSDVDKTILPTDTLRVVVTGTGSVSTASVGLFANVELLVSE